MTQPIEITDWATSGAALKTATDSSRWTLGWQTQPDNLPTDTGERPNLNQQNYWQNSVHVWLQYLNARAVPSGTLTAFAGTVIPGGYLPCDGLPVSRVTYADLFAALGTTWGIGDGATTFNLPDLGGRILKGAGAINDGNGGDTVALGTFQDDSTATNGLSNSTSTVSGIAGSNGTSTVSGIAGSNGTSTVSGVTGTNGTSTVSGITGTNSTSSLSGTTGGGTAHSHGFSTQALANEFAAPGAGFQKGTNNGSNTTNVGPSALASESAHTHGVTGSAAAQSWTQTGTGTAAAQSWTQTGTGTALAQAWSQTGTATAAAQSWNQTGTATAAAQTISGEAETRPKVYGVNWMIKT